MESIESQIDTHSPQFRANIEHHRALVAELRERLEVTKSETEQV